jgi:acetoin utilization protein AcuC
VAGPGAAPTAAFVWSDELAAYDFGPTHPMQPVRLRLTGSLIRHLGLLDRPGVRTIDPEPADDAALLRVHAPEYLAAVRAAGRDPRGWAAAPSAGLGSADNPAFAGMHEASARIAGSTLAAARAVLSGARRGVSLAGGLHHAMPDHASGFCVYNDLAVAIADLLAGGVERIAYVDTDVHHGDGVQEIFAADPRVLTVSLHQDPRTIWPGTGYASDIGVATAPGTVVNVALPPRTTDAGWLRAFHAIVPDAVRAFAPQVLVTQHGCDTHRADPIGGLMLTVDGQRAGARALAELADEVCDGRWIATGGGGYALVDVVPRTWSHVTAAALGAELPADTPVPAAWLVERDAAVDDDAAGEMEAAPLTMGDGAPATYRPWESGHDPADPVDRAILATRRAAFPALGLLAEG